MPGKESVLGLSLPNGRGLLPAGRGVVSEEMRLPMAQVSTCPEQPSIPKLRAISMKPGSVLVLVILMARCILLHLDQGHQRVSVP